MLARTFDTVLPFAQELAEQNVILNTQHNSLLNELTSHSSPLEFFNKDNSDNSNPRGLDLNGFKWTIDSLSDNSTCTWSSSFDNSVEELSKFVRSNVSYIRNIVCSRMKEFEQESMMYIQDLGSFNPSSELEIIKCKLPELCEDESFLGMLNTYNYTNLSMPRTNLNFQFNNKPESFIEVTKTGNARLDTLIKEWVLNQNVNYLEIIWQSIFNDSYSSNDYKGRIINYNDISLLDINERINASIAYFLIANYYYNNSIDAVTKISSSEVKNRLKEHKDTAGKLLVITMKLVETNIKNNIMIFNINRDRKNIVVSADVYDRWLATGGKPETILGLLVSNKTFYSVGQIDENSKILDNEWNNYSVFYVEGIEYKKSATLRTFYKELLNRYLVNPEFQDPIEISYVSQTPNFHNRMLKEADDFLYTLKKEQLCDCWFIAKNLIAKLKYNFTYAYNFIEDMCNVEKANSETSPEEASMIAQINYIVDYLLSQINVVRHT